MDDLQRLNELRELFRVAPESEPALSLGSLGSNSGEVKISPTLNVGSTACIGLPVDVHISFLLIRPIGPEVRNETVSRGALK